MKLIHKYVDDLVNIGWSMVELGPSRYKHRTDVSINLRGVQEYSRNIRLFSDGEKVEAMLNVYMKEWDETSSLLRPQLCFFHDWCRKNVGKTMRAGEGSPVENNVESEESTHE